MQGLARMMTPMAAAGLLVSSALLLSACATTSNPSAIASEQLVKVTTASGTADALLFTPAKAKAPAVILWGDLGGLRPVVVDLGRKLAGEGFTVLAPNAFYRNVELDGTTTSTLEYATRNRDWRGTATDEAILEDAKAFLAYLDRSGRVDATSKAGAVGYDIGAVHAFLTARAVPDRIGAVAAIQPLAIATARPNSPHLFVGQSKAAYYIAIGKNADAREPEDKNDLQKAFADTGLAASIDVMPGDHGFALADNPAYDVVSADTSWAAMIALLKGALK